MNSLGLLKKLANLSFRFRSLKDKHTLWYMCLNVIIKSITRSLIILRMREKWLMICMPEIIFSNIFKCSKTKNILQTRYLEVKKQESKYELYILRIKCSKQCTRDAFRGWNVSSKLRLNYLEIFKHEHEGYKLNKKGMLDGSIVSAAARNVRLMYWKVKIPQGR